VSYSAAVAQKKDERKVLLRNRKARHEYEVDETLEVGVVLLGSEVKSLREGHGSLVDAYGDVRRGELWLIGAKIDAYPWANQFNHEPLRARKLLAHRQEIRRLMLKARD
jgi:SsrA-binding protein